MTLYRTVLSEGLREDVAAFLHHRPPAEQCPVLRAWSAPLTGGYAVQAQQITTGTDVLARARQVRDDPVSPNAEVRYTAIRLTECLADALCVAESRGMPWP